MLTVRNIVTLPGQFVRVLIAAKSLVAVLVAVLGMGLVVGVGGVTPSHGGEAGPGSATGQDDVDQRTDVRADPAERSKRARSLREQARAAAEDGDDATAAALYLEAAATLEDAGPRHVANRLNWIHSAMRSLLQAGDLEFASECFWKIQRIFDEEGIGTFSEESLERWGTSLDEQFRSRVNLYRIMPVYDFTSAHVLRAMDEEGPLQDRIGHLKLAEQWLELLDEQVDRYQEHLTAASIAAARESSLPQAYGVLAQIALSFVPLRSGDADWKERWHQIAYEYAQTGLEYCDPPAMCHSMVYGDIIRPLAEIALERAADWEAYTDAITELVRDLDQQPLFLLQQIETPAMQLAHRFLLTDDPSVGRDAIRVNRLVTDLAERWYPERPDQVAHYFVSLMRQLRIHAQFDEREEARHALERAMMCSRPARYDTELQRWQNQLMPDAEE